MKALNIVALALILLVMPGHRAGGDEKTGRPGPGDESLYLHCFKPTRGQRVVLDPEADMGGKPATPPARLVTLKVDTGRSFEVIYSSMHRVSGRITRDGDSHVATLEGAFGSGFKYSGKVELEKVFDPEVTWFSGAVFRCRCVFSKNKDVEPFLEAQAEIDSEKLRKATETTRRNNELREKREAQNGANPNP